MFHYQVSQCYNVTILLHIPSMSILYKRSFQRIYLYILKKTKNTLIISIYIVYFQVTAWTWTG